MIQGVAFEILIQNALTIYDRVDLWVVLVAAQFCFDATVVVPKRAELLRAIYHSKILEEERWMQQIPLQYVRETGKMRRLQDKSRLFVHAYIGFFRHAEGVVVPLLTSLYFVGQLALQSPIVIGVIPVGYALFRASKYVVSPVAPPTYDDWTSKWEEMMEVDVAMTEDGIHGVISRNRGESSAKIMSMYDMDIADDRCKQKENTRAMAVFFATLLPVIFTVNNRYPTILFVKNFQVILNLIFSTIALSNSWATYKREEGILKTIKDDLGDLEEEHPKLDVVSSHLGTNKLCINTLRYKRDGFDLTIDKINLWGGMTYLVSGPSGSGKTTFLDIVGGILPTKDMTFSATWNGMAMCTFKGLIDHRIYVSQEQHISEDTTIYNMVVSSEEKRDPALVIKALEMAFCGDFVSISNDGNEVKKDLYKKNPGLSGGQKARIGIASSLYRCLVRESHPAMVIFDEIDRALQEEMALDLVSSLVSYFKEHGTMVFVCAHLERVKQAQTLWNGGVITFLNGHGTMSASV